MIDAIDRRIPAILQPDARTSNVEIARRVGRTLSAVLERVHKRQERGADAEALGRFLRERIGTIPTIRSTRTLIVLRTVEETTALPRLAPGRKGHR